MRNQLTRPGTWKMASLAQIVKCQGGSAFSPSLQGRGCGEIPFYKVSDMNLPENRWTMRRANNYVSSADRERISGAEKPAWSVIFPKVGATIYTNKKRILAGPAFVDNNVMAVWPIDQQLCIPAFLYLHFLTVTLSDLSNAGPLPSINNGKIYELSVSLPPRAEQEKIAAVLWKVQRAIEAEEKLAATSRELKHSAMRQLFTLGLNSNPPKETEIGPIPRTWDLKPLEQLRQFLQYGTSAKCDYAKKGNPVIRIPNVLDGKVRWDDLKWCELSRREVDSLALEVGDVLFIRSNGVRERVGTCAVYRGQPERALFASYLIRARLKADELNPYFFQYFTATSAGLSQLGGQASPAADGKFNINTKTIDSVLVPLPDPREQCAIVATIQTIDRKIAVHERKRAALQDLFKTLLRELMTAQIRVDTLDIDTSEVQFG